MRIKPTAVVCLAVLIFSAGLLADMGKELYQFRYGDQRKQVDATGSKADDVALAAEHLKDAAKYVDSLALFRVLCEEAYELGMRDRSGYATAVEALEKLLAKFPASKDTYRARALRVYEVQYRQGIDRVNSGEKLIDLYLEQAADKAKADDFRGATSLSAKAYGVASGVKSPRKPEVTARRAYYQVRRKLQQTPDDPELRGEAIRLCVAEMDDPTEAVKLLDDNVGEPLRTYVPLAAQQPEEILAPACLELGYWYGQLAKKAGTAGKAVCLRRARVYLERYLRLHEAKDEARTKAELLLDRVTKEAGKLEHVVRPPGPSRPKPKETGDAKRIDLLKLVDPAKHGVSGTWQKKKNMVGVLSSPYARLTLPVAPEGDYTLGVVFVRQSGRYVVIMLPVGSGAVAFCLGYSYYPCLRTINGSTYYNRESHLGLLLDRKEYTVIAKVAVRKDQARVVVYLNGMRAIQWQGNPSTLAPYSGWSLPDSRTFGLGAYDAQVLFKEAKVMLDKAPKAAVTPKPEVTAPAPRPTTRPAGPPGGVRTAQPGEWIDLLKLVDPKAGARAGKWVREGTALRCVAPAKQMGVLLLPAVPAGSYEVQMTFVRRRGKGRIGLRLPVGKTWCTVALGMDGRTCGLGDIRGKKAGNNETTVRTGELAAGRKYTVTVKVKVRGKGAAIAVDLDGKRLIRWSGPLSALGLQRVFRKRSVVVGIGSTYSVEGIKVRKLSGQGK